MPRLVARAFVFAGLLGLVVLTLAHPSSSRLLTWPWALLAAALWLQPLVAGQLLLGGGATCRLPNRLITTGLGLLAAGALLSACLSPFSAASFARIWPTLGGVAFFFWLHHWLTDPAAVPAPRDARLARVVAIAGALVVVVSVVGWWRTATPSLWSIRNAIPFGHSNYTAGFVVLLLPWFAHQAWETRGPLRATWLVASAAALLALAGTSSRGGVLALVVVAAIATLAILVGARWSRGRKLALVAALAALGALVILTNPRLRELVLRRGWSESARESNRQRAAMLTAGLDLGRERPLVGWGPGTIPLAYPRVRAQLDGGVDNVLQLHNTPVQVWATLGLAGVTASLLFLAGAVQSARRALREPWSPGAVAALASLGGYAVFSLTDHQLDLPAFTALAAVDLAWITAAARDGREWPASRPRFALALLGLAAVAAPLFALVGDLRARHAYDRGLVALEAGRPLDFIAALDAATRLTPHDPYFQHQAVGALLGMRDTVTDPARRAILARDAVARLEASLATGVHLEFAHFNLGWLLLDLGDFPASARHFAAAARLVPDKGGVYFGLGLALQSAGRPADAVRAFALEWISDPRSQTSPAWEIPALAAVLPAVRAETLRLYDGLRAADPRAATAAAWTRWWNAEIIVDDELKPAFTSEAAAFVAALPAIETRAPVTAEAPWANLYREWRAQRFTRAVASDPAVGAALVRRTGRHGDDFLYFLRAGTEDEAALVRTWRRTRTGYGVLALHPDGPALADAYIVQENRFIADYATGLFPPKGWLPGRFLLALLPPDPR